MTPAPTDSREKAADALDRVDALLDRIDQAASAVLAQLDQTPTETSNARPPDQP